MIRTTPLEYNYPGGKRMPYPSLSVQPGGALLILGQSGCGKTTLLHMLGGLLQPQKGQIFIHGQDITALSQRELDHFRGQHIGFVFQRAHFIQSLTVQDNLMLAPYFSGKKADTQKLHALCDALGIAHLLHQLPARLSQGEQQRASIARAIMHQPDVVLADEPTSSLDDANTTIVGGLLLQLCKAHQAALIVVTHDERLKKMIADHITLLP